MSWDGQRVSAPSQLSCRLSLFGGAQVRVEDQLRISRGLVEIEHIVERASNCVIGALADPLAVKPIVFDEAKDRRLVRDGMVHEVVLRVRRNHQQRLTRTITAAAVDGLAVEAR